MVVAHAISGLAKASGPTTFCVQVADHLARLGVTVRLYVESVGANPFRPREKSVEVIEARRAPALQPPPDLIHAHAIWLPSTHRAIRYAKKTRTPCVLSAHGMLAPWALDHKRWKKKIAWLLYQKRDLLDVTLFHATAPREIEWIRQLSFKQPCVLAPLASELPEGDVLRRREHAIKRMLFVGRVYPVKGLENLLQALAWIKEGGAFGAARWQAVIAGPDQAGHMSELMRLGHKLGLTLDELAGVAAAQKTGRVDASTADVVFTGGVYGAEKHQLHLMCDLFVLPSFTENFGAVVTDALAYGLPVITTHGTPWAELRGDSENRRGELSEATGARIRHGESFAADGSPHAGSIAAGGRCGWWVDIGVAPLAEALREAVALTDDERHQMGLNGRALAESKYMWPGVARKMRSAYEWLLTGGTKPDCIVV